MIFGSIPYCSDTEPEILCKLMGMFWYISEILTKQPKILYRPRLRGLPGKVIGKSDSTKFGCLSVPFSRS